jgi:hypothetical protein
MDPSRMQERFFDSGGGEETRTYIRPRIRGVGSSSGPDGICASSPNQVNGLELRPFPHQVLKKLVSATYAISGRSSIPRKS